LFSLLFFDKIYSRKCEVIRLLAIYMQGETSKVPQINRDLLNPALSGIVSGT